MTLTGPSVRPSVVLPEKVHGVHQLSSPAGDEEWEVRPGLQAVPEDDPSGQSQACHPGQQLPRSQVGAVLMGPSLQSSACLLSFINAGSNVNAASVRLHSIKILNGA